MLLIRQHRFQRRHQGNGELWDVRPSIRCRNAYRTRSWGNWALLWPVLCLCNTYRQNQIWLLWSNYQPRCIPFPQTTFQTDTIRRPETYLRIKKKKNHIANKIMFNIKGWTAWTAFCELDGNCTSKQIGQQQMLCNKQLIKSTQHMRVLKDCFTSFVQWLLASVYT